MKKIEEDINKDLDLWLQQPGDSPSSVNGIKIKQENKKGEHLRREEFSFGGVVFELPTK